jgi:hypothetical protein
MIAQQEVIVTALAIAAPLRDQSQKGDRNSLP